jgi:hypothetical protein
MEEKNLRVRERPGKGICYGEEKKGEGELSRERE